MTGMGRRGEALATLGNKGVFVFGAIQGETVIAKILREHRDYIEAQVVKVEEPSPHRITPPCPHFGPCTGCQWQHISYNHQLNLKREIVSDSLKRIGGLENIEVEPTLPSPNPLGYRNHARMTISKDGSGRIGFVNRITRQWVPIDQCLIMTPWINETIETLQQKVAETTQLSLRYGINTGSKMIQPTLHNPEILLQSGQKHYQESLLGQQFQVSSPSFFQVNTPQAEQMTTMVLSALKLSGKELVLDAYAGVGTFAVALASKARQVIAIEESPSALDDAKINAVGYPNIELVQGKVETVLGAFTDRAIDVVILDPPRAGCHPTVLDALIKAKPKRVVYISCDPETLSRDLALLTKGPYEIKRIQPIDMFPQTHQIEILSILEFSQSRHLEIQNRQKLILASTSPRRQEILSKLGLPFNLDNIRVEEPNDPQTEEDSVAFSGNRAISKAQSSVKTLTHGTVISADTVVELDGIILEKPKDEAEAASMLKALRGREHRVVTSIALIDAATGKVAQGYRASRVMMRNYTDEEIYRYIASGSPMDKAGAYGIQDKDFLPASEIRGCYLNIMGLPVCTLLKMLGQFGITMDLNPLQGEWEQLRECEACINYVEMYTKIN
jgi:23S rRNA (uracil1939-C5)-methyltransferase